MTTEEKIKETIANIQIEFALSYSNLTRHLKKSALPVSVIADYCDIHYHSIIYPSRHSEQTQKTTLKIIKKINIDKLAKWFLGKNSS